MKFKSKEAYKYYQEELSIAEAARRYCEDNGIEYTENARKSLSSYIHRHNLKKDSVEHNIKTETFTETNQYSNDKESEDVFMPSAWDSENNRFLDIDQFCDKYNLPKEQVRSSKLVAHQKSHMTYNIAFNPTIHEQTGIDEDFIQSVVEKHIEPKQIQKISKDTSPDWFDRLVITDLHIGMDPNGSRNVEPLYEGNWNKEELMRRLSLVVDHVSAHQKSSTLIIDDLGDLLDGLEGQTTRKGHHLPQNMSDKEAFDLAIEFKITLIEQMLTMYDKILCNNICEDNHSGFFSYFTNKTCKLILEQKYENVKFNVMERFINHYTIGQHTFLITHGKDSESLKFGFKPILDTKQIEKIDQYCKEYNLYNGNFIEFSKGDSHQAIFDDTTSNDFVYYNYPAFSPPSNWVKSNFKNSKSGFVFFNIDQNSQIKIKIPYYFY